MAQTAAWVNITAQDNATLQDAFQFGTVGDTSWSFAGQAFEMGVKASRDDVANLFELLSASGSIVVDDVVQRVLHLNVPEATLQTNLPCGEYDYDLVMFDTSVPPIRTVLMRGKLTITRGVTES